MRLAVLKERRADETRVAATPDTVKKLIALGLSVSVEAGAGHGASISDAEFTAAGAEIAADVSAALGGAGIVFAVQTPEQAERSLIPRGALLVCISGALSDRSIVASLAQGGIDAVAMELLPRITRAQSMDVLSSQANLAGYRAVIEGAAAFDRGFAMMMTAAGTVPPARVFVLGAGVAGLQAIATARRLGAIVSATDVRPAAKEEIRSLGATFVGVEDAETAGQTGAYAKDVSDSFRSKQAELMLTTVAKNDMIICTALVQGGRAPTLVSQAMVDAMKPGSVIVDLASDGGGNCAATHPGEAYTTANGVKILGFRNWPGRISVAASTLYAKNLLTFLTTFWDKDAKAPKLPPEDAIVQGVTLTRGGHIVHAQFAAEAGPAAAPQSAATSPAVPVPAAMAPASAAPEMDAASPVADGFDAVTSDDALPATAPPPGIVAEPTPAAEAAQSAALSHAPASASDASETAASADAQAPRSGAEASSTGSPAPDAGPVTPGSV